jgi:thiamine biosynthesis protein ThiS
MKPVEIQVNGSPRRTTASHIGELARELDPAPQTLLIEHNGIAVLRSQWDGTPLAEGDRIEILKISAGG